MKQFIYLDTDSVDSIIAQKDKGLVSKIEQGRENTSGDEYQKTDNLALGASANSGIQRLAKVQAELKGSEEVAFNDHAQTVVKRIITKTLHDAAFDIAYEQISNKYTMDPEDADLGSFIELKNYVFEFVDLVYMEGLFSENGFIDYLKETERKKIEQQTSEMVTSKLNQQEQRKSGGELKKEIKRMCDDSDKSFDDMIKALKAIRQMIPYNRMLVSSKGYLIPLEDKYFRDNPQTMGFKHGGYITCVGYITNVIGKTCEALSENIFSSLQTLVNQALVSILATKEEDLFVVHPIALYYGQ